MKTNNLLSCKYLRKVFTYVFLFFITTNIYAQSVNITKQNTRLADIFEEVENQTKLSIAYSESTIDKNYRVSVDIKNKSVNEAMAEILKGTGATFLIEGQKILIKPAEATPQKDRVISGTVSDELGEPVIGANVVEKGTANGTVTDIDGRFTLSVSDNSVLQISYIGYMINEIPTRNLQQIKAILKEDSQSLDEVVVVGFGTQKKANLTGAVGSVQMDKVLGDRPVTSLGGALQGAIPGFTASPASAMPGDGSNWNIRGLESITGGSPLILVDNVVFNDLYLLNPADIESVSVLKDASSAAIYGARASFGVILITTKKGKKNETLSINYNNNFAVSKVTNLPELASPVDFVKTLKDGGYTSIWSGQNIDTYMDLLSEYNRNPSAYPNGWTEVNGTKYFLRENPIMTDMFESAWKQTHNLSAQGGSERIKYRLSLGYTHEDGVLITNKDAFTRANVTGYVSGDITSWLTTSLDISYNNGNKKYPFLGEGSELGFWKTNLPSYHPTGSLPYGTDGEEFLVMSPANTIKSVDTKKTVTDNTRLLSRSVLKPFDGFEAVLEYSYQASFQDIESYANYFRMHQGLAESIKPSTSTTPFTQERKTTKYTTINAFATYNKTFNDRHTISALAGFNQEKSDYRYLYAQAYNMISNELPSLSGTDGVTPPKVKDDYTQYALRSGFFRASYNYMQRYFLEVNGRYDLSSKFPKNYRSGFFPSVSAGWSIVNEPFMEKASSFLSALKLRGSYGTLGNQNIDAYSYYPTMEIENAAWLFGGNVPKTLKAPGMVRANFTWEKVESINGGVDFGVLSNRLTGTFDIYRRNTIGMLGPSEEFPAVAGAKAPLQNAADLKTKGWELSVSWRDRVGKVDYGLTFNLYDSRSYITRYKNETGLFYERNEAQDDKRYRVGMEIGEIWGYVTDGFYTADDFTETGALKEGVVQINGVTSHVGDIKYKNLLDDDKSVNVIDTGDNTAENPGDRKIIGNSRARLQYALNGYANWKGFGFSFILQGVGKRDAWIGNDITFPMAGQYSTVYTHQVGQIWTEDNPNAFYGRIYENAGSSQGANQRISDKFLYNAAYLRVKNITLSYTIPDRLLRPVYLKNLKAFVSAENLITFDHLPAGIDPENLGWKYPFSRTISFGINFNL